jgi:hypothetical protein
MRVKDLRQPVDIERLLTWTYRDQRADKVLAAPSGLLDAEAALDGHGRYLTSGDGVASMARIGALGVRVDGGGPSSGALHPDAEIVDEAVTMLGKIEAHLVITHARGASRPDQIEIVPPRAWAVRNRRGRATVEYEDWDRNHNYGFCPVQWTVAPTTAEVVSLEYAVWWRALDALAVALSGDGRLTRHRPLRPAAPPVATVRYALRDPGSAIPDADMLVA